MDRSPFMQKWYDFVATITDRWNELDRKIQAGEVSPTPDQMQKVENALDAVEHALREVSIGEFRIRDSR